MANIINILDSPELRLPMSLNFSGSFGSDLDDLFGKFINILAKSDHQLTEGLLPSTMIVGNSQLIKNATANANLVKSVIKAYLEEGPINAYKLFERLFNNNNIDIFNAFLTSDIKVDSKFYRIRNSDTPLLPEEMFHIPFESRHVVSTQRYSIPGCPCLYLGSTIEVCCKEMNIDTFDKANVIGYKNMELLRIRNIMPYDLTSFESQLNSLSPTDPQRQILVAQLLRYAEIWPLIAACYMKIDYGKVKPFAPNPPFKYEYILPQLLLLYFNSYPDKYNGIRYLSARYNHKKNDFKDDINYVFPVEFFSNRGHCISLRSIFKDGKLLNSSTIKVRKVNEKNCKKLEAEIW